MLADKRKYDSDLAQFVQQNYNINPQVDLKSFWKSRKIDNETR